MNDNCKNIIENFRKSIDDLQENELKKCVISEMMSFLIKEICRIKFSSNEMEFIALLKEFIEKEDSIIKVIDLGIVLDKYKLYKYFEKHGYKKIAVLDSIDLFGLIPSHFKERTPLIKIDNKVIRAIVIKKDIFI